MKIKQALDENRHGDSATQEDKPHQRPTLLHVVDHPGHISEGRGKRHCGSGERGEGSRLEGGGAAKESVISESVISGASTTPSAGTSRPSGNLEATFINP